MIPLDTTRLKSESQLKSSDRIMGKGTADRAGPLTSWEVIHVGDALVTRECFSPISENVA